MTDADRIPDRDNIISIVERLNARVEELEELQGEALNALVAVSADYANLVLRVAAIMSQTEAL